MKFTLQIYPVQNEGEGTTLVRKSLPLFSPLLVSLDD
jgi:hypothetical protein